MSERAVTDLLADALSEIIACLRAAHGAVPIGDEARFVRHLALAGKVLAEAREQRRTDVRTGNGGNGDPR